MTIYIELVSVDELKFRAPNENETYVAWKKSALIDLIAYSFIVLLFSVIYNYKQYICN